MSKVANIKKLNVIFFDAIKTSTLKFRDIEIAPETRTESFNIFLTIGLTIANLEDEVKSELDYFIENYLSEYCVYAFRQIVQSIINYILEERGIEKKSFDFRRFFEKHDNLVDKFESGLLNFKGTESKPGSVVMCNTIDKYVLHLVDGEIAFDRAMDEYIRVTFSPGKNIDNRYTLIKQLSNDKSEIWSCKDRYDKFYAIKFRPIEELLEGKEELEKLKPTRLAEIAKERNPDYVKRKTLSVISGIIIGGYASDIQMAYFVTDLYEGSLDHIEVLSVREPILKIFKILNAIHKQGISFNNISPQHVVVKEGNYHLLDYKRITRLGDIVQVVSESGYASLSLLKGRKVYPYDDIESLLYLTDYLMGNKIIYGSVEEEIELKESLTVYNPRISNAIKKIRQIRSADSNANQGVIPSDIVSYIDEVYSKISKIFRELFEGYKGKVHVVGNFNSEDVELVEDIKNRILATDIPVRIGEENVDNFVVKVENYIKYNVRYSAEDQALINSFLNIEIEA